MPKERNPRRPIQTQDRYEALLKVADSVTFEVIAGRKRRRVRSYLSELLVLANETGRRLSAILGLHYEDLDLEHRGATSHTSTPRRSGVPPQSAISGMRMDLKLVELIGIEPTTS